MKKENSLFFFDIFIILTKYSSNQFCLFRDFKIIKRSLRIFHLFFFVVLIEISLLFFCSVRIQSQLLIIISFSFETISQFLFHQKEFYRNFHRPTNSLFQFNLLKDSSFDKFTNQSRGKTKQIFKPIFFSIFF